MRVSAGRFTSDAQLAAIDDRLARAPGSTALRFARACALEDLDRIDEAVAAYRDVLAREPRHVGALTNLAANELTRGDLARAWDGFQAAAASDPADGVAQLNLAQIYAYAGAHDAARAHVDALLGRIGTPLAPRAGLALLEQQCGGAAAAAQRLAGALQGPFIFAYPYRGTSPPLRVLSLTSAVGGDLVGDVFFDEATMQRIVIVAETYRAGEALPSHDVIFNAIGEPDRSRTALAGAAAIVAASGARTINDPRAVLATDRLDVAARFAGTPGVVAPLVRRFARDEIDAERLRAAGFTFPLLLRAPGFHEGQHFALVATPGDLAAVRDLLPGAALYAIAFHDLREADGWVRKYRVVFVGGKPYPVHLAIARQWKIHYFSAAMAEMPEHRTEEERFLRDPGAVLGAGGMRALAAIASGLALDYGGVDFGRDATGRLVIFEANATMAVYAPAPDAIWAYRRPAFDAIVAGVRALLRG